MRGTSLGVPYNKDHFWGLCWGPLIYGKYPIKPFFHSATHLCSRRNGAPWPGGPKRGVLADPNLNHAKM